MLWYNTLYTKLNPFLHGMSLMSKWQGVTFLCLIYLKNHMLDHWEIQIQLKLDEKTIHNSIKSWPFDLIFLLQTSSFYEYIMIYLEYTYKQNNKFFNVVFIDWIIINKNKYLPFWKNFQFCFIFTSQVAHTMVSRSTVSSVLKNNKLFILTKGILISLNNMNYIHLSNFI